MAEILKSTEKDIDTIFVLYDNAVAYQKTKFNKHWLPFDREMVRKEIEEGRQWKIMEGNEVAWVFAVAYEDPFIWAEKNADPFIYLHRIVTHSAFHRSHRSVDGETGASRRDQGGSRSAFGRKLEVQGL